MQCFWKRTKCVEISFPEDFVLQIGDATFTIPMVNLTMESYYDKNRIDCDLYIVS